MILRKTNPWNQQNSFSTCIDKKNGTFLQKTTFQFLTQPDVVSAINSITADNIFDYYQQKMSNSKLSQVYQVIVQDLEEVLESNFFKEDTTRVLKDIKDTWVTWKKQRIRFYKMKKRSTNRRPVAKFSFKSASRNIKEVSLKLPTLKLISGLKNR
ncbi:hypothetical protein RhiirA1_542257 [Rhizophagus irregularis]|uniref:Uncharacterized protein n=1 Tax=Rhizophagus irregularis TaxID=588596 RepID=A0A2I1EXC1_9GLOM|nr:hypothetical protein RhiirA1_542257 [Rhizophagus irregularis]PKY26781.1 hypothetical protein RhiirB3_415511 [Rhizophagus irregularis]